MKIYYNSGTENIDCWCTRWSESNYDVTVETFLDSAQRSGLFDNVVPGAVGELMNVLGEPTYIDLTYSSGNTLKLEPVSGDPLADLVNTRVIGVKTISDTFLTKDSFSVKIEGKILG